MAFQLSSHEVMRGVKVRDGRLVLRAWGWYHVGSFLDVPVALGLTWWAVAAGGLWLVTAPWLLWTAIESAARARVAVFATPTHVTVRNRFRTHTARLSDVDRVGADVAEWALRQPVLLFMPASLFGREWQVGVVWVHGQTIHCDALVCTPPPDGGQVDPTVVEMKAAALERWIAEHRGGAAA